MEELIEISRYRVCIGDALKGKHQSGNPWCIVFPFTCWNIWLLRNKTLFQNDPSRAREHLKSTIASSIALATEWNHVTIPALEPRNRVTVLVKWCTPGTSFFKLNTDGACKKGLSQAQSTGGGLIRDDKGNWVVGFHRTLRQMTALEAELWALRDGLELAYNRRLVPLCVEMDAMAAIQLITGPNQPRHVLNNLIHDCRCLMRQLGVEMDAMAVIQLITGPNQPRHVLNNLIHDCRCLMRQLGVEKIDHTYREGNKCADLIANMSFDDVLDFHVLDVAPVCINSQLCEDANGVEYPRLLYAS